MEPKKHRILPPLGGSSLLTIIGVLCLTTLALLSLATAHANVRLSERSAEAVGAYYAADSQAEALLAQLRDGQRPEGVKEEDGVLSYACPLSDGQILQVQVALKGTDYTVLQWQTVSLDRWQADDTLPVWQGNTQ